MSLSVREKRPPGGCAGFFFQLVGWNRLLARKKQKHHFPRKLLPKKHFSGGHHHHHHHSPVNPNKLLLIAEENRGGFPSAGQKKLLREDDGDDGDAMRPAGLLARLMGLESMPVAANENPRKPFRNVGNAGGRSRKSSSKISDGYCLVADGDPCLEACGAGKAAESSRPPKLQKTGAGLSERQTANAGANVVGKSRRRQHKLPLPSTSPRSLSGGHRARLLQAATKILEPGMRPPAHSKFSLTNVAAAAASSHCNAEQASNAALSRISSRNLLPDSLECKTEPVVMLDDQGRDMVINPVEIKSDAEKRVCDSAERKWEIRDDKDQCVVHIKGKNLRRIKKPATNGKAVAESKVSTQNNGRRVLSEPAGAEVFAALARNQKNCALMKSDGNGGRSKTERYGREKSMTRKRGPVSNTHSNNFGVASSAFGNQCGRNLMANQRGKAFIINKPTNSSCLEREGRKKAGSDAIRRTKKDDVVSFTFVSPMQPSAESSSYCKMVEKTQGRSRQRIDVSQREGSVWGAKRESTLSKRMISISGDELSKLLDQKISELIPFDKDDLARTGASSERYVDSVLREPVPYLDTEAPKSHQSGCSFSGGSTPNSNIHHSCIDFSDYQIFNDRKPESRKSYMGDCKTGFSAAYLTCDVDQPSPTSILEASFSTDSCSVGSPNDNQGSKLLTVLVRDREKAEFPRLDFDLSDSPTFVNAGKKLTQHFFDSLNFGFLEAKLKRATGAISDIEVLLSSFLSSNSNGQLMFSLDSFLLDMLEAVAHALYVSSQDSVVLGEEKEGYQLGGFLFDCMIEFLDSNYSHFCKTGYKTWSKLLRLLSKEWLMKEVSKEIRACREMAGKALDNLVEKEFDCRVTKWTTFENEAFEVGMQIENNILQALVDEFVFDLW